MGEKMETLLEKSGEWGRYQKIMVVLISLVYVPIGFTVFAPVFTYHMPQRRCYIPEIDGMAKNSSTANRSSLEDYIPFVSSDDGKFVLASCARFVVSETLSKGNASKQNESKETEECLDGWVYMDPENRMSASTEFNLVCENAWRRPLLTSSLMIGFLLGSIVSGPLNDKFGRRKISLINTFLNFFCIFASSFSPSYEWLVAAIIIIGITHIILYSSFFVLAQELVGRKHRAAVTCSINVFYSLGYMLLPGVAYLLTDWRWIIRGLGLSFALFLPYIFILPESPRWLASKGRNMDAYNILKRIAQRNGKDPSTLEDLKMNNLNFTANFIEDAELPSNKSRRRKSSVIILATNTVMRTRSLLICWVWNVAFLCYFALAYNTSNLGGNNYWNCFIAAALDIPCHFFVTFSIQKFGRRSSVATFIGLAGLFLAISPAFVAHPAATISFAMIGKFFAASTVGILYLYTSEIYPTLVRSTGVGLASMSSRIACMLAPFLIFAGENGDRFVPFYVMATLGLLTAILSLFLPETKHTPLPDTMLDAVAMGNDRPFPFIPKRFRKRTESQAPLAAKAKDSPEDCNVANNDEEVFLKGCPDD